jgi:2',3'-cyclic-nucleotide 2'-phosphodiesterase (5'-nucleotidase family)
MKVERMILFFFTVFCMIVASKTEEDSSITFRIIHITDVYTLHNFASLKTLIDSKSRESGIDKAISLLSGDFLMPYLLSSLDGGKSMMRMINAIQIDFLTWGNHEKDLPHDQLMLREREYKGIWINTNMQSHESFANSSCQVDHEIIVIDRGNHIRKIGLLGILTNSESLYPPGSFNGAIIEDPWETMRTYNELLRKDVDLLLPICHLYETQDERTAREFDFPLIIGGHDHHAVDRIINGTHLLKPGSDSEFARIIDITWEKQGDGNMTITTELLTVKDFHPNADILQMAKESYEILRSLRETQFAFISENFRPLTSRGARANRISIATYLATIIRDALNVDAVLFKAGNIRGSRDYDDDEHFSMEMLQSELENVDVYVTQILGSVLEVGLHETWTQPNAGWLQYDKGISVDFLGRVTMVNHKPIVAERMYRIASFHDFFRKHDSPTIGSYYEKHPVIIRVRNDNVYSIVRRHLARIAWKELVGKLDSNADGQLEKSELSNIDINHNSQIDKEDILFALEHVLKFRIHHGYFGFAEEILLEGILQHAIAVPRLLDANYSFERK